MKKSISVLLMSLLSLVVFGQAGKISGRITDAKEGISFANIILEDANLGAVSDENGVFEFRNIPIGEYRLLVSYLGYETYRKKITVLENKTINLEIELRESSQKLEGIVLTGVTRETLVNENPISVSIISQEEISLTSENNIVDVLVANTPGLNVVKSGPNISKPFIRGLGYNRVLTLYDGMRQEGQQWGDEHGLEVDDYNIARAEVIKGPSSLMYGSDAIAGVVSLFTKVPKYNDGKIKGSFISEYQTNNGLIGNGLRLDYNDDNFVFAIRGSHRMAKNYKNAKDNRVYLTNFKETNFSALAGYESDKGYTHLNFTLYDNVQGIPDGSRDSISRKFTKQIYEDDLDDDDNRPIVSDKELNSYKIPILSQHIQHYRLFLHSNYAIGDGDMDILLGGQQNIRREYNHPTAPEQAGMYVRLNTLNYSFRYNLPKFSNVELAVGVNGMAQNNKNLDATDFPIPDYDLFDFGTFVYAKWKKDRWTISGGLRYDLRQEKWKDFYVDTDPETGFDRQATAESTDAELPFPAFKKTFQDVSASLGTTFKITNEISLKANIGRAFRAPNITELASNGLDPGAHIIYLGDRTFNPEISLQEDIGINARFADWSAELSIFNNNIQNYIFLNAVPDENGNPLVDNQGNRTYKYEQTKAQVLGGEFWLSLHPKALKELRFDNSFSIVHGYNRASEYKAEGVNGRYLPLIPPFNWKSNLSYAIPFKSNTIKSITPKIGMEHVAEQNQYFGLNNSETKTASYTLFNLGFSTDIAYSENNKMQFLVHVNNLFDTAYQSHLNRLKYAEDYEDGNGIYDMGRNITFKLIFGF